MIIVLSVSVYENICIHIIYIAKDLNKSCMYNNHCISFIMQRSVPKKYQIS